MICDWEVELCAGFGGWVAGVCLLALLTLLNYFALKGDGHGIRVAF